MVVEVDLGENGLKSFPGSWQSVAHISLLRRNETLVGPLQVIVLPSLEERMSVAIGLADLPRSSGGKVGA